MILERFGGIFGVPSSWKHFGVILGSFWGHCWSSFVRWFVIQIARSYRILRGFMHVTNEDC